MIFWEGWLHLASADSNKWKKRFFRVRDNKFEYLEVGGDGSESASNAIGSALNSGLAFLSGTGANREGGSEGKTPKGAGETLDKDRDVAKVVGEAPQAWINLDEDITGFTVLGSGDEPIPCLRQMIQTSSLKHASFHKGLTKLLLLCKPGRPSFRIAIDGNSRVDIKKLLLVIERAVVRAHVLLAGWISTPGTINWNRRYAVVLSTGSLLIFKDPSLDNLRRDLWLGESDCAIQPLKPIPQPGSTDEQAVFEALTKSYNSSKSFVERITVRVSHASISDRKGYLMSVERLNDQEPPQIHLSRYREWTRVLSSLTVQTLRISQRLKSPEGQFLAMQSQWEVLRNGEETKRSIQEMINLGGFHSTPSLRQIAKAGIPQKLRPQVWNGVAQKVLGERRTRLSRASSNAQCRTPRSLFFNFPLKSSASSRDELWLQSVLVYKGYSSATVEPVVSFILSMPNVGISCDFMSVVDTLILSLKCAKGLVAPNPILEMLLGDAFLNYNLNPSSSREFFDDLAKEKLQDANLRETSFLPQAAPCPRRESEVNGTIEKVMQYSLPLQIDVQVALDLVGYLFPTLSGPFLEESKELVGHWLLSLFTRKVPFSLSCSQRLWDLIIVQISDDEDCSSYNLAVRIAVAIFALCQAKLEKAASVEEWLAILEGNSIIGSGNDTEINATRTADFLVFKATKDRRILKFSSWSSLKDRRSQLWNASELKARERIVLVNQWLATSRSLVSTSGHVLDVMNNLNKVAPSKERDIVVSYVQPVHVQLVELQRVLGTLEEAMELVRKSLLTMTTKSSVAPILNAPSLEDLIDQCTSCSGTSIQAGGQVCVEPFLVVENLWALLKLSWELASCARRCMATADAHTFESMTLYTRCVTGRETGVSGEVSSNRQGGGSQSLSNRRISQGYVDRDFDRGDFKGTNFSRAIISSGSNTANADGRLGQHLEHSLTSSLTGVAGKVRPPGDPKLQGDTHVGQIVHDEFQKVLSSLLGSLEEMVQCIVDTTVERRRRSTETGFVSNILSPDIFGGRVFYLSQLVPTIISIEEEISKASNPLNRNKDFASNANELSHSPTMESLLRFLSPTSVG